MFNKDLWDFFDFPLMPDGRPGKEKNLQKHLGEKHDQKTHGKWSGSSPNDYAFATKDFEAAESYGSSVYLVSMPNDAEHETFLDNPPGLDFMSRTGFKVIREVDAEIEGDSLYHGSDRFFEPGSLVKPLNVRRRLNKSSSVLKHQQGKHDQKSHGRWAGSADFSEWGDRKGELISASTTGPSTDTLTVLMGGRGTSEDISDEEIRDRITGNHGWEVELEVQAKMKNEDENLSDREIETLRDKYEQEVINFYAENYDEKYRNEIMADRYDPDILVQEFGEVYSMEHSGTNREGYPVSLSTGVDSVEYQYGQISVRGSIYDSSGYNAGEFHRIFEQTTDGTKSVEHALLHIYDEENQGSGFSKVFNRQAENYYISHNVNSIDVHAALDGGGYAWAKQGFGWRENTVSQDTANISKRIDDYTSFKDDALSFSDGDTFSSISMRFKLLEFGDPDFPTPMEVADVGRKGGDENWAGKEVMRGSEWFGKKTLSPEGPRKSDTQIKNEQNREPRPEDGEQLKFNVGKSVTLTFAPGLVPILKNAAGKHDQRSHGSWAAGAGGAGASGGSGKDYSEWGRRAAELRQAENRGPSEENLRRVLTGETELSESEIRDYIIENDSKEIDDEVARYLLADGKVPQVTDQELLDYSTELVENMRVGADDYYSYEWEAKRIDEALNPDAPQYTSLSDWRENSQSTDTERHQRLIDQAKDNLITQRVEASQSPYSFAKIEIVKGRTDLNDPAFSDYREQAIRDLSSDFDLRDVKNGQIDIRSLQSFDEVFNLQHVGTTRDGTDVAVESIFENDTLEYDSYRDSVSLSGDIKTPTGFDKGSFTRRFSLDDNGDIEVEHVYLRLPEDARGAGFGQEFIRQSENYYITHGVKRVNVGTGLDDGGYHWAKAGFKWDTSKSESEAVGDVDSALDNYFYDNSSIMSEISDIQGRMAVTAWGDKDYPSPSEIADIGIEFKEDNMWAGKEILSGTAWYGTKEMVPED